MQSLAILNPFLVLCCGVALLTLRREQLQGKQWFLGGGLLVFLWVAMFTMLPVQLKDGMASSELLAVSRDPANIASMVHNVVTRPRAVSQSLFFLFAPSAIWLLAIQLGRSDLRTAVPFLIGVGTISGIFGVLQLAGSANSPFYFYRITNSGSAVGLFANRNHSAVFLACIFPMIAVFAAGSHGVTREDRNVRTMIAVAIAILLVPLILVTGSRSGLLVAIIGLSGAAILYSSIVRARLQPKTNKSLLPVFGITVLISVIFATIYFSRAEAIERVFSEPDSGNNRADFWSSGLQMFWQYFPFGFGPGGFVPAFQMNEPLDLLSNEYLNRLHNDWLEIALTFGVPGVLLMVTGIFYYLYRSFVLWMHLDGSRSGVAFGRMASIIISIIAVASLSDYPMRTPAIAGLASLALVWFTHARSEPSHGKIDSNI